MRYILIDLLVNRYFVNKMLEFAFFVILNIDEDFRIS